MYRFLFANLIRPIQTELKCDWSKYFANLDKVDYKDQKQPLYNNSGNSNFYIEGCTFNECRDKGAIYIHRDECRTLVERCNFINCSSNVEGGSIYYKCNQGDIVQHQNSFCNSLSTNDRFLSFSQSVNSKNYALYVSVSNCDNQISCTLGISGGEIRFCSTNITNNNCNQGSSIFSHIETDPAIINFSNFIENSQTGTQSLIFENKNGSLTQTISYCNINRNICGNGNDTVLFYCEHHTSVNKCTFLCNIAKYIFQIQDSNLTISNSHIQSNISTFTGGGTLIDYHNTYTDSCKIESSSRKLTEKFIILKRITLRR